MKVLRILVLENRSYDINHNNGGNKVKKKNNSVYAYFDGYDQTKVDAVLDRLNESDRELFEDIKKSLLYGKKIDSQIYQKFYSGTRVKIFKCLEDPTYIPTYRNNGKSNNVIVATDDNVNKAGENVAQVVTSFTDVKDDKVFVESDTQSLEKNNQSSENLMIENSTDIVKREDSFTKDDYSSMLELLRSPSFTDMMSILSAKEAVIISLRLGYVDGKCFTPKAISNFLRIDEEEVNETTKKVLLVYKDNFNSFIDKLLGGSAIVSERGRQYIKLPENKKD